MAKITEEQIEAFVNEIGPIIQQYAMANGYSVASPIIAQACLESRYGDSDLAKKHHNYFGLKAGSSWKGKSVNMKTQEEYRVGTLTTIRDNFRAYDSMKDGVKGYFDFISTKRYANLKAASTPEQYLAMIKSDGYATDSRYVEKNMAVVVKYGLTRFDTVVAGSGGQKKSGNPYPEPTGVVKLNSRGNHTRWLQYELNCHGAKLVVDGIAGSKTIAALMAFQDTHGLEADGICGQKTKAALIGLRIDP